MRTHKPRPLRTLSLGAGVQSSTLALMAEHGEFDTKPDCAIFADTQAEPQYVYDWLDWIETQLSFPVYRVTHGNLGRDFLETVAGTRKRCASPPFMSQNRQTGKAGRLRRQCTSDYKIKPIKRLVRELRAKGQMVEQWIGISMDEAHRMKPSDVQYIQNRWPLLEKRFSRQDCLRWMAEHGYPQPKKSACYFCPYMDNARLRKLRDTEPEEWRKLVEFDATMREIQPEQVLLNGARYTGDLYVHRDCVPITEVDLSTDQERGQSDLFGEECEGMCGL